MNPEEEMDEIGNEEIGEIGEIGERGKKSIDRRRDKEGNTKLESIANGKWRKPKHRGR
jgi:hypothetical protein